MLWKIVKFLGFCYIFKYKVWKSWLMTIYWIIKPLKMKVHLKIAWPYKYNYLSFREAIEPLAWRIKFVEIYETVMIKWLIMLYKRTRHKNYCIFKCMRRNPAFFFCDLRTAIVSWMHASFFRANKKRDFSTEGWNIRSKYCMNKKHRGLCRKSICETDRGCHTPMSIYKIFFRVLG